MTDLYDPAPISFATKVADLRYKLRAVRTHRMFSTLEALLVKFSPSERLALYVLTSILALSAVGLVAIANRAVSVEMPAPGGKLVEGEVGTARFINPILMISQSDQDIAALVYSGLVRVGADNTIIPDLASSYTISPDGTTYTFNIRKDATFHDGTPLTAVDVLFTVALAQKAELNSPQRANWEGVRVSSPDQNTVIFTLSQAYAPFIENASMGILPKHLWQDVAVEDFPFSTLNTHPVGSGPYKIASVANDSNGAVVEYELVPFAGFTLGEPYISSIKFVFFHDKQAMIEAFDAHKINSLAGPDPATVNKIKRTDTRQVVAPLPRVYGIFFNQSHNPVLTDVSVREALNTAVDKEAIINDTLNGYGSVLDGPIPPIANDGNSRSISMNTATTSELLVERARAILDRGGWSFNVSTGVWTKNKQTLSLTLSTSDAPELVETANAVARNWRAVGVLVRVAVYPITELNRSIIRPRDYDAILFGEVVGRELDLYAFWESKERNDPGLNLALYANSQADAILTKARATHDQNDRATLYEQFARIIDKDQPAVFLYAPEFIYVVPKQMNGIALASLTSPSERFLNVYEWHTNTKYVWRIFVD